MIAKCLVIFNLSLIGLCFIYILLSSLEVYVAFMPFTLLGLICLLLLVKILVKRSTTSKQGRRLRDHKFFKPLDGSKDGVAPSDIVAIIFYITARVLRAFARGCR